MGGFGDADGPEDLVVDAPDDVGLMEEQPAAEDDELEQEPEKEEKKGTKKKAKKSKKNKETKADEQDEEEVDQLPEAFAAQFQAQITRSGRQTKVPKKLRGEGE